MRYILSLIFLFSCFYSCEEVEDITLPDPDANIVIDAQIQTFYGDSANRARISVDIRYTDPFFEEAITYVNDARPFLINLETSDTLEFNTEDVSYGSYRLKEPLVQFNKEPAYEVLIIHNKQVYKAQAEWKRTTPIDTIITLGAVDLDEFERTELKVYFTDIKDEKKLLCHKQFFLFRTPII